MWTYEQATGKISRDGRAICAGYSGCGAGVNNPAMQAIQGVGPIPQGRWAIGAPHDSPNTGPYSLTLTADQGTDTFGRSAFRIHGDNRAGNRSASHGCIILPPQVRRQIWGSGDHDLEVVA